MAENNSETTRSTTENVNNSCPVSSSRNNDSNVNILPDNATKPENLDEVGMLAKDEASSDLGQKVSSQGCDSYQTKQTSDSAHVQPESSGLGCGSDNIQSKKQMAADPHAHVSPWKSENCSTKHSSDSGEMPDSSQTVGKEQLKESSDAWLSALETLANCAANASASDQPPSLFKKTKPNSDEISSPLTQSNAFSSDSCITVSSLEGKEFSVSASVLSEGSGYFRSCLRSGMKESLTKTVQFANLTSSVLETTLTFLTTSACTISLSTVKELLFASTYLQIPELHDYCCVYLTQEINLDTYSQIYSLAESCALSRVQVSLNAFLCESISEFSATSQFKDLSTDQLFEVLNSDQLNVVSEREVLDLIVLWLQANKELIEKFTEIPGKLLSAVRIPCLYMNSHEEISTILSSVVKDSEKVTEFLDSLAYYQSHPELCHQLNITHNSKVRKGVEVIMTLGGLEQGIWKKQPSNKTKFAMTSSLPDSSDDDLTCPTEPFVLHDKHTSRLLTKVYEHCICTLDNYVYLAGGQTAEHDRAQFATSAVYRFDPRVFEWTELCPMTTCRSLFYLGSVGGKLYAVGGASQVGVENTVECYDPSTNRWTYMKPMTTKLHEHAGCVLEDCIHISGGHDGVNGTCDKTWCYYPDADNWLEKAPMRNARSNHAMVAVDKTLIVIGGCTLIEDVVTDCWECESYDMTSDQWTVITSVPRLTSCPTLVTVDKDVLCFGGYTFSFSKYVDMVQVYNMENKTWKTFKLHMNVPKCLLCEKVVVNELMLYAE